MRNRTGIGPLSTDRLELIPCSLALARAAVDGTDALAEQLGARVPDGWPSRELSHSIPVYVRQLERDEDSLGWGLWLVLDRDRTALVGDAGFKGRPDAFGRIEIGYGIAPEFRRRGYAIEAAGALIEWAFEHPDISCVEAECLDDNVASIRVLAALGMRRRQRDGRMLRWVLNKPS